MHNFFILQQYVCYTKILNMFEDRNVIYILLKNKEIVH